MSHTLPPSPDAAAAGSADRGWRPDAGPRDPYAVWRIPSFRLYATGWFLMTFAKQIEMVAVGYLVYDWTKDQLALGWIGLIQALPVLLLAIPGGHLADRVDRRRVVVAMLAINAMVAFGLSASTLYVDRPIGWMYGLLLIGAVAQAVGGPSRTALLPQLVRPRVFSNAVAWSSSVFQVSTITGPAVGGLILVLPNGGVWAFATVVACRLLSLAAIANVRCERIERKREAVTVQSLLAGIRFVRETKLILAPISLDLFAVLVGGLTYLLPVFAADVLHVGSFGLGLLRSADAVGAVFMTVLITHRPPMHHAGRTMLMAVGGFGVATVLFGLSRWFWLSMLLLFVMGALDTISVVVRHTLVQVLTPDSMRGRVSAVNNVFIVASNDLGGFESGVTAWLFGPVVAVVAGGVGAILIVCGAARLWPDLLTIGALHELRPLTVGNTAEVAPPPPS